MSQKPGLGSGFLKRLEQSLLTRAGSTVNPMEINSIRMERQKYPIGRYLKDKLREQQGIDKHQRKAYHTKYMLQVAAKKLPITTLAYEKSRKAHVQQQPQTKKIGQL